MEKPKLHVVSFSGGKDSTAMLLRMIEEGMRVDLILYCDTGLEFPEMEEHIRKVEEYIGRKITVIKSEKDFMYWATEHKRVIRSDKIPGAKPGDIMTGYAWPAVKSRWCTRELKTDTIADYLRGLKKDYDLVQYVGIASDEPQREREHNYPLIKWGMTEADCLKYCYDRGFTWGGLYDIWDRVSCWCCPLQGLEDLRKLRKYRPELWERLREMDRLINEKCIAGNPPGSMSARVNFKFTTSFRDIERRFEVEDEFIAQGKKLRTKEFYQTLKDRGINY